MMPVTIRLDAIGRHTRTGASSSSASILAARDTLQLFWRVENLNGTRAQQLQLSFGFVDFVIEDTVIDQAKLRLLDDLKCGRYKPAQLSPDAIDAAIVPATREAAAQAAYEIGELKLAVSLDPTSINNCVIDEVLQICLRRLDPTNLNVLLKAYTDHVADLTSQAYDRGVEAAKQQLREFLGIYPAWEGRGNYKP